MKDIFPYKASLTTRLQKDGMEEVLKIMDLLNPAFGMDNNTVFFNYCKWFIEANTPALSKQIQEAEALVRFLSGTTLVLLVALPASIGLLGAFIINKDLHCAVFYSGLLTSIIIGLLLILERFKYQRRREVILVWTCIYMIIKKGTFTVDADNRKYSPESMFFSIKTVQDSNQPNPGDGKNSAAD